MGAPGCTTATSSVCAARSPEPRVITVRVPANRRGAARNARGRDSLDMRATLLRWKVWTEGAGGGCGQKVRAEGADGRCGQRVRAEGAQGAPRVQRSAVRHAP